MNIFLRAKDIFKWTTPDIGTYQNWFAGLMNEWLVNVGI